MEVNEPMHNGILSGNKSGKELGFIDRFFDNDLVYNFDLCLKLLEPAFNNFN
jgi:hypothetical protein